MIPISLFPSHLSEREGGEAKKKLSSPDESLHQGHEYVLLGNQVNVAKELILIRLPDGD